MSTSTTTQPERITCQDVQVGDQVAQTKAGRYHTVTEISEGDKARYLTIESGGRLRPRRTTKLWRLAEAPAATTKEANVASDDARQAMLKRAGMSTGSELTSAQSDRLDKLVEKAADLPDSLAGAEMAKAIMQGKGMPAATKDKPAPKAKAPKAAAKPRTNTATAKTLKAAVDILRKADAPLNRLELEKQLARRRIRMEEGKTWRPSDTVHVAAKADTPVDGYIIRQEPKRGGGYYVEEAPAS